MELNGKVLIEFVQVWGHPTRNEIYGPPERVLVSEWVANHLVSHGIAKRVANEVNRRAGNDEI